MYSNPPFSPSPRPTPHPFPNFVHYNVSPREEGEADIAVVACPGADFDAVAGGCAVAEGIAGEVRDRR